MKGKPVLIKNGTRALAAPLGDTDGLAIAFSTTGELYIGTFDQMLRLTSTGKVETVRAVVQSGSLQGRALNWFEEIALNDKGDIYSSCGMQGWAIWRTSPDGRAGYLGYARRSGGNCSVLQRGPDGAIYGENASDLLRLAGHDHNASYLAGRVSYAFPSDFFLSNFAFGSDGALYADSKSLYIANQELVEVRHLHLEVLWQEGKAARK